MLTCTLRGKPGRGDLGFEDALTATVFERLGYLEPALAYEILLRICPRLADIVGRSVTTFRVDLWPVFPDATAEQQRVEPDVVLDVGAGLVVIEAKRPGGQHWAAQVRREVACVRTRGPVIAALLVEVGGATEVRAEVAPLPVLATRWVDFADAVLAIRDAAPRPHHVRAVLDDILLGLAAANVRALRPPSEFGAGLSGLDRTARPDLGFRP